MSAAHPATLVRDLVAYHDLLDRLEASGDLLGVEFPRGPELDAAEAASTDLLETTDPAMRAAVYRLLAVACEQERALGFLLGRAAGRGEAIDATTVEAMETAVAGPLPVLEEVAG